MDGKGGEIRAREWRGRSVLKNRYEISGVFYDNGGEKGYGGGI